jgi:hypothetical protein
MADTGILNRTGPFHYAKQRQYSHFPMVMNSSVPSNTLPCKSEMPFPSGLQSTSGSISSNWSTEKSRAERSFFNAELARAQTKGILFHALVNLYKAMGGGWVAEVGH